MPDLTENNDVYTAGLGEIDVNALGGVDTLIFDYSSLTGPIRYYDWYGWRVWTDDAGNTLSTANFERFNLTGGSEGDDLRGADLADTLRGGGGNDVLRSYKGADLIDGGAGYDRWFVDYSSLTKAINLTLLAGGATATVAATGAQVLNIEALTLWTGGNADTVDTRGVQGNDEIYTNAGNDTVRPGLGFDTVNAGDGADLLVLDYSASATDVHRINLGYGWWKYANDSGVNPTTSIDYANFDRFDLTGGLGADQLFGAGLNDTLRGGGGNDTLTGYGGVDVIDGGLGVDLWAFDYSALSAHITVNINATPQTASTGATLSGIERLDAITGIGNDTLIAKAGQYNDRFDPRDGNDAITSGRGRDWLNAGNGDDLLIMNWGAATTPIVWSDQGYGWYRFTNGQGDQIDFANVDRFNLTGGSGADTLVGFGGLDTLAGGDGNDWLNSGSGRATITGGAGTDYWQADLSAFVYGVAVNTLTSQTTGQGSAAGLSVKSIEGLRLDTGAGNDNLSTAGYATDDRLYTNAGNDTVNSGLGFDTVHGGDGVDSSNAPWVDLLVVNYSSRTTQVRRTDEGYGWWHYADNAGSAQVTYAGFERFNLTGGSADDQLFGGANNDTLVGGAGKDYLDGGAGVDVITGGEGIDRWAADYGGAVDDLSLTLTSLGNGTLLGIGTTLSGIEQVTLTTGSGEDNISTGSLAGNDVINTNGGDDLVNCGSGRDEANGSSGVDKLIFNHGSSTTAVTTTDLGYGWWLYADTGGLNSVKHAGFDNFDITTGSGHDRITTWGGADILRGNNGNDALRAGAGNDTLQGGSGNDWLVGEAGNDVLTGSTGTDRFKFVTTGEGVDTITDFTPGADRIAVVSSNFASLPLGALAGNRLYAYGATLPSSAAVFLFNGNSGALYFDSDGNGAAAAVQLATLTGVGQLAAGDIQVVAG